MKNSSTFVLVLCLLALGSATAALRAEEGAAPEGKKEHHSRDNPGEMMKQELGLTEAQSEQMKAVREETEAQMKAIKDDKSRSKEDKKAAGMKLREATKAKIDAILNPEQKAKFDKMREAMKKKHSNGPGGRGEKEEKHGKSGVQ